MTLRTLLLPFILAISLTANAAYADDHHDGHQQDHSNFLEELNERDFVALRDFLKTKREETIAKKAPNITLSGDVRFEWRNLHEHTAGKQIRGGKAWKKMRRWRTSWFSHL